MTRAKPNKIKAGDSLSDIDVTRMTAMANDKDLFVHIKAAAWAEILPLITPESSSQRNGSGCVPLHEALAAEAAPLEVLSLVLCAYPDAARVKDKMVCVLCIIFDRQHRWPLLSS